MYIYSCVTHLKLYIWFAYIHIMDIIVLCHNIFTYCDCTIHNLGLIILTHAHIYHRLEKKIRGDLSTKHVGSRGPHRRSE